MTDKEFKRLRKKDFIEIIYQLQKELEETRAELERVRRAKSQVDLIASLEAAKIEIQCMSEEAINLESKLKALREEKKALETEVLETGALEIEDFVSEEVTEQETESYTSEEQAEKEVEAPAEEAPAEQEQAVETSAEEAPAADEKPAQEDADEK